MKRTNEPTNELPGLTKKEAIVLELLVQGSNRQFGLEMVNASGGLLRRGTIYVVLQRMEERGFVESQLEPRIAPEIGIPRRVYWVTGYGLRVFRAYGAGQEAALREFATVGKV